MKADPIDTFGAEERAVVVSEDFMYWPTVIFEPRHIPTSVSSSHE
jgi:hypothetical protein